MKILNLLFCVLTTFVGFAQSANVYTNSSTGNDLSGNGTQGNPYQTFHKAYQMVAAGGTIYLSGTFDWTNASETGDVTQSGYGITKNLTIIGDSYQSSIIQAASSAGVADRRIFTLGATLTLWNLTLRFGKANLGGAISTTNGTIVNYAHADVYSGTKALNMYNCSLNNNQTTAGTSGYGAAVYIRSGAVIVDKCIVTNNTGVDAINVGGEGNGAGSINATNCYFGENHYYWSQGSNNFDWGGGINLYDGQQTSKCNGFATNCTFASNGRGVRPDRCNFAYTNCTFINNATAINAYYYNQYFKNNVIVGGGIWVTGTIVDGGYNYVSSSNLPFGPNSTVGGTPTLNLDANAALNSSFNITNTFAINASSSVLIDAGNSTAHGLAGYQVTPPCTDQRGYLRNGTIDIGAFEYNGITTVPTTTVTGTLSPFSSYSNIASTTQSFDVVGSNLTANVIITAPTGFQVSTSSSSGFASSVTLTHSGGTLNTTTIHVRMLAATTPSIANITVVSSCTDTKFLQVSGTVLVPTITASPTSLSGFSSCLGTESTAQSTTISGANLSADITLTAPNGYEISLSQGTGYSSSITLTQSGGTVASTTIYVRISSTATAGNNNGNLSATSGSSSATVALSGVINLNTAGVASSTPTVCSGSTMTAITHATTGATGIGTASGLPTGVTATWASNTITISGTPTASGSFNYTIPLNGGCGSVSASGTITVVGTYTWTGTTSTDPLNANNWNPAAVPCSGANEVIPSGLTNYPAYTNLTIDAGTTFTVQSGAKLNITGVLTNNGTMTIESGATLVQGSSSTVAAGSGTYNVKQSITGANNGSAPNGRFWYLGSPVATSSSSVLFANTANVVKKRDEATNAWIALASGTPENLSVGRGYYTQAMANATITFTGGAVNNGDITISGLSRTASQGFEGFNLVSNPYPSYLNWDNVVKTEVSNTMWYRTFNSTNNTMVFDTYVAGTNGIGTNLNGAGVSNLIPPMQSFWVRVNANANPSLNNTGSLGLTNAMRAHFTSINGSVAGLKSTSNERDLFLRMNLLQADKKDQLIVYVNETATNGFDLLDGEKMMQAGFPQFYTKAGDKKIVINGLNSAKKQQSLPITMELPTTGVHSFIIEDLEISNGLVWLEDKQEEIIQALEPGTVYEFYAASGMNAERFVLHFQLIDDAVPTNVYNEVNSSANFSGKGANVHAEAAGVVVIKLPASTEGVTDIQIRDAAGRVVYSGSTNTLETSVQLSQANGIYYVTLNSNAGVEVRKVFIQQ